jgi:hypothetical protein
MKILSSYFNGFKAALKTIKLITAIYAVTLILALVLAIPFGNTIQSKAGNSMAFTSLLKDFNYTVYKDFMKQFGDAVAPYISSAIWMGIFYILFTIFFEGGVLTILKRKENKYLLKNFWEASAEYFLRFLRLAVYSIIIQVLIALAVYIPLGIIIDSASADAASIAPLFYIILTGAVIHLVLFIFILIVTDYAKIMIVELESYKPLKIFLRSFGFVIRHFFSTYFLYLIILIAPIIIFLIYFRIERNIGMSTGGNIFLMFIIQQIVICCRVFIKLWFLGSQLDLYRNFEIKEEGLARRIPVFEV